MKTPFDICVCATCGPPWRQGFRMGDRTFPARPKPADDAPLLERLSWGSWMTLCPRCGSKRCPGAGDHDNPCRKEQP